MFVYVYMCVCVCARVREGKKMKHLKEKEKRERKEERVMLTARIKRLNTHLNGLNIHLTLSLLMNISLI